jgi:hypothetical protein
MGEARRRKQLDRNWGKANRQSDSENQGDEIVSRILNNPKTVLLSSIAYMSLVEHLNSCGLGRK